MFELNLILLVGLFYWFWSTQSIAREKARIMAKNVTLQHGALFLDDSVALKRITPYWDGKCLCWRRRWAFEFSLDGSQRLPGIISMIGNRVQHVRLLFPDHMEHITL